MTYATAETSRPTRRPGRRPYRSENRPHKGALASWAIEKAAIKTPTTLADACAAMRGALAQWEILRRQGDLGERDAAVDVPRAEAAARLYCR